MTASVKLSKNQAPTNTNGMKYKNERTLNVFCNETMISAHPSNVTDVKTAKNAK